MQKVGVVASRIIALFLGVGSIVSIISYLISVRDYSGSGFFWAQVLSRLGVALLLWLSAEAIGGAIARGTSPGEGPRASLTDLHVLGLSLIGVWFVAQAIPSIIEALGTPRGPTFSGFPRSFYPGSNRGAVIGSQLVQAAIGLGLIVAARTIAEALARRGAGPRQGSGES